MGYINEQDAEVSLKNFAQGDTFSLFKLALQSIYEPRELLKDSGFVISMLKTPLTGNNKLDFLELLIDNSIDFSKVHIETNAENLEKFNEYWKGAIAQPAPLFFSIIPYINDEQLAHVIKEGLIYNISDHSNIGPLSESLVLDLFEKGYDKSISILKDNYYYFFNSLNIYDSKLYPGQKEEKTLEEIITPYSDDNPSLLYPLTKFFYNNLDSSADKWITRQLEKPRKDNFLIQKFFDTTFEQLSNEGKEAIIAKTLHETVDLDFTMIGLKKIGVSNFSEYKPGKYPIWISAEKHKNKSIYRKFLRNGVSLFDYYQTGNKTFLSVLLDGVDSGRNKKISDILEEQKIEYKQYIRELLEKRSDEEFKEYTNFSLLLSTNDGNITDRMNLNFEDISNYSKKFLPERWEKLKLKEKFEILNDVVDRTFLAETHQPKDSFYKKHIEKMAINFNLYMNSQYSPRDTVPLIDSHLNLLSQVEPDSYNYRPKYFQVVSKLFDIYPAGRLEKNTPIHNLYSKMIDYVATDKNLDWAGLSDFLSSEKVNKYKNEYCEGSLELFNYLQNVSLSHTLRTSSVSEKKKLKI